MATETTPPPATFTTSPQSRKSKAWILILIVLLIGVTAAYEWRYSDDMQQHIAAVNHDLEASGTYGGGLIGALQNLTDQADVSRQIMETQQHVHTLKDEVLARKIKQAVQQSSTIGEAIGRSIEAWQQNFAQRHDESEPTASFAPQAASPASGATPTPSATATAPAGNWQVDHNTNPVTGVITTTAYLRGQGKQNIYIRQRGNRAPDCYINTEQFLETVDNMESRNSTVQYRIDEGKPVRQTWVLSDDNLALFYPGSCAPFIAKLHAAKHLAFEYKPAERIESTLSFDVEGLPDAFKVVATPRPKRETQEEDMSLPRCADHDWQLPCRS